MHISLGYFINRFGIFTVSFRNFGSIWSWVEGNLDSHDSITVITIIIRSQRILYIFVSKTAGVKTII